MMENREEKYNQETERDDRRSYRKGTVGDKHTLARPSCVIGRAQAQESQASTPAYTPLG